MNAIYTIGYSGFEVEGFVKTLLNCKVSCLVDVRSLPQSAYFKDFNRENISRRLNRNGILYRNYAREFGARQSDENFCTNGIVDFAKFSLSQQFLEGVSKIEAGMSLGYTFAFMCAEKRPETCHRCILVAREFYRRGYEIRHLLDDGSYINQAEVEKILLNKYFPDRNQISLFEELSCEEMINRSYAARNLEIGYRTDGDDE